MSVQAITWALNVEVKSAAHKAVLIVIANYADADGFCWPSQKTVAKQAACSERTVRNVLSDLEDAGIIARTERRRPDRTFTTDGISLQMKPAAKSAGGVQRQSEPLADFAVGRICQRQELPKPAAPFAGPTTFEPTTEPSNVMRRAMARDGEWKTLWSSRLKEAQGRADGGINMTSGEVHHLAIFTALCEPVMGEPCDWDLDVLPAVDALAAACKATGRPFRTWKGVGDRALENRDRRLAGLPAPKSAPTAEGQRRTGKADAGAVIDRIFGAAS